MLNRQGAVAIVSGANRGLGRAIAAGLAGAGWQLSLGVRQPDKMDSAPKGALIEPYNARDPGAALRWVAATLAHFGRIDAVVANAGIWLPSSLPEADPQVVEEMWRVNALAPMTLVQAAWEPLKASGSGRFLAVASLSGKRVFGGNLGYAMSKFALVALAQQVKRDGWDHGIRATAVCPSWIATDMASRATIARSRMTQPEDLAALVSTILALPNNAGLAEVVVNCEFEPGY